LNCAGSKSPKHSNAEKTRQELANAQAKAQEILAQAGAQANKIIEETRAAAAQIGEQERQKSVAESQKILAKAHEAEKPNSRG